MVQHNRIPAAGIFLLVLGAGFLGLGIWGILIWIFGWRVGDPENSMFIIFLLPGALTLVMGFRALRPASK